LHKFFAFLISSPPSFSFAGELVTSPAQIAPALRRAFAANVPYLVNVVTDPEIAYPRSTAGM